MGKFDLDLELVRHTLFKDNNKIPVRGNEHRMIRVAFDLFRLKDDEKEDLWQVQADDDGEFLVRTYSLPDEDEMVTSSDWSVIEDSKQANLTISYKGIPIQRLNTSEFSANTPEDVMTLKGVVLEKLANDNNFLLQFISTLPKIKRELLKEAGVWEKTKKWLSSKDVTDKVISQIEEMLKDEEDSEYSKYFKEKAKEFGSESGSPKDIPEDKRDEFFEEVDKGWKAENECLEKKIPLDLAALELELHLKKGENQFDISDVKPQMGELDEEEKEDSETFLTDEDEINEIIKKIEELSSQAQK